MASDYLPYFKFFPRDWLTSPSVMLMSLEEQGAYLRMLCMCWMDGSVPRRHLRGLLQKSEEEVTEMLAGPLGECFEENDEGNLVNARLEGERQGAADLIEKRRKAGKARAAAHAKQAVAPANNADAEAEADYRKQKRKGKRRNAVDEFKFAVSDWERLNGPMPSLLLEAMEEYLEVRRMSSFPMWTREMWMKNLAGFHPRELAEAFQLASRSGWRSVHPKKKSATPTPGQRAQGNDFADMLEDNPFEQE